MSCYLQRERERDGGGGVFVGVACSDVSASHTIPMMHSTVNYF